jgi:hypothetical protein
VCSDGGEDVAAAGWFKREDEDADFLSEAVLLVFHKGRTKEVSPFYFVLFFSRLFEIIAVSGCGEGLTSLVLKVGVRKPS